MAEFTGKIGTPSEGFTLKVEYSYTQSITNNTSTLTVVGYVKRNNSSYYPYNSTSTVELTIDGTKYSFSPKYNLNTDSYVKICTKTVTLNHNADGTKSVAIKLYMNGKLSNYYPNGTISKTITLETIARASSPTISASSIEMGSSLTITTNRASSSFTHIISYNFGNTSDTIASGVEDIVTWFTPLSLASQIPNSEKGTCTIICQTYSGNTLIGTKSIEVELKVPNTIKPTVNTVTISEGGSTVPSSWGCYVQNKSKLKVVTTASGSYGSTIKSYKITGIDDNTYNSSNFVSNVLKSSGTKTITATVTDSRGRTGTKTVTYICVPYFNPTILATSATRCNEDGTVNEEGTYVKYTFKANVSSVNNKNSHFFKIGYKTSLSSSYTYVTVDNNGYSLDKTDIVLSDIIFSVDNSYDFQFWVNDYFTDQNPTIMSLALGTGFTLLDFRTTGKGMAIGKVSEKDKLEVALESEFSEQIYMGENKVLSFVVTDSWS